jgi:hypothetical protein
VLELEAFDGVCLECCVKKKKKGEPTWSVSYVFFLECFSVTIFLQWGLWYDI